MNAFEEMSMEPSSCSAGEPAQYGPLAFFHLNLRSQNGVVLVNARSEILRINAHAEKLFSYSRSELMGQPVPGNT